MINDLLNAYRIIREHRPPKVEIWVMGIMPRVDEKGDPVIVKVDFHELQKSSNANLPFGLSYLEIETITGADFVILMHPETYSLFRYHTEEKATTFDSLLGFDYGIPAFDDVARRDYFNKKRKSDA